MKKIMLLLVLCAAAFISNAQKNGGDYNAAIGARFGTTYYDIVSFSYKKFTNAKGALEFNAGFGSHGYGGYNTATLSGALSYQWHFDIPVEGLKWFVGGGATVFNTFSEGNDYEGFGFGLFPTGGIDYKFPTIPLNLTADVRPTFLVASPSYYNSVYTNFGFAVRYTIK
jgi:hypothetical protein